MGVLSGSLSETKDLLTQNLEEFTRIRPKIKALESFRIDIGTEYENFLAALIKLLDSLNTLLTTLTSTVGNLGDSLKCATEISEKLLVLLNEILSYPLNVVSKITEINELGVPAYTCLERNLFTVLEATLPGRRDVREQLSKFLFYFEKLIEKIQAELKAKPILDG